MAPIEQRRDGSRLGQYKGDAYTRQRRVGQDVAHQAAPAEHGKAAQECRC